uniref:GPN-loop GTPase 3 n=1 Tax=Romanomermis culicivorax TaxID=13658 RepID=A0A915KCJ2_ROMCU
MRYCQLVIGPAGSGKSTYCNTIVRHCESLKRVVHVVNLDPAAEKFDYPCDIDIRDLVQLEDIMEDEELHLGPNGGLVYALEYFASNLEWLEEQLGDVEDDYVLFDCPGQIELYTHIPVMKTLVDALQSWNFRPCAVFLLDTQFMLESTKFFSGTLVALSAMVNLEIPHVNVLTKMDLLSKRNKDFVENFLDPDAHLFNYEQETFWDRKHKKLTRALARLLENYSLVKFVTLDSTDEESVNDLLLSIDNSIQYGEDAEIRDTYVGPGDVDEPENGKHKDNGLT